MPDIATIGIKVDAEDAVAALDRVTAAAERANAALHDLAGKPHGGISITIVGEAAKIDIAAPTSPEVPQRRG